MPEKSGVWAYTPLHSRCADPCLARRAALVYWESLLRYVAALLLIPAGMFGDIGGIAALLGLGDLGIGLIYMFGLKREPGVSHRALLLDHQIDL